MLNKKKCASLILVAISVLCVLTVVIINSGLTHRRSELEVLAKTKSAWAIRVPIMGEAYPQTYGIVLESPHHRETLANRLFVAESNQSVDLRLIFWLDVRARNSMLDRGSHDNELRIKLGAEWRTSNSIAGLTGATPEATIPIDSNMVKVLYPDDNSKITHHDRIDLGSIIVQQEGKPVVYGIVLVSQDEDTGTDPDTTSLSP